MGVVLQTEHEADTGSACQCYRCCIEKHRIECSGVSEISALVCP